MKKKTFYISILSITLIFTACGNKAAHYENESSVSMMETPQESEEKNTIVTESGSTPASPPNFLATSPIASYDDGVHKFIRTADLKFKVDDVVKSTATIEEIIIKNQGFIIKSNISNNTYNSSRIKTSKDSILEIYMMNLNCNIELRVPANKLDTALRELAPLAVVVDYRNLEAQDITAQLMAENLKKKRNSITQQRVSNAIDNKGQKLDDITDAEETRNRYSEQEDAAIISAYQLNDQIAYSRITINLYQAPTEYRKMIKSQDVLQDYDSGVGNQLLNGLKNGWGIVMTIVIALVNIWPFVLVLIAVIIIFVRYTRKKNQE